MSPQQAFKASRAGIILLKISFWVQIVFLVLSYSNFYISIFKSSSSFSWLSSFVDAMAYVTYINIGSCATQFFLIRLFSIQLKGQGSGKNIYLLGCLAATIYGNWYLIEGLINHAKFSTQNIADFAFEFGLMVLILIAIMSNSHILGIICSIGSIAMTVYNISILTRLYGLITSEIVTAIIACEVIYGLGLALCCFGITKPVPSYDEKQHE